MAEVSADVEVIEFTRPFDSDKNVYVTRLPVGFTEVELQELLESTFCVYGLIYDIKLFQGNETSLCSTANKSTTEADQSYYSFVTFYSAMAARKAIRDLTGRFIVKGSLVKVQCARRKPPPPIQPLFITKCYELASYYLGFNGWSVSVDKVLEASDGEEPGVLRFITQVTLTLPNHDLDTDGFGEAVEKYKTDDVSSKAVAYCKVKKLSYSAAVVSAFQKVVLVVTSSGKLHVEINTTVQDLLRRHIDMDNLLQVNELDESPPSDSDDNDDPGGKKDGTMSDTLDAINVDILADLVS